ncbi:hypothetical protein [Chondrinema litorale]|uniref:hypothetical protein n=1 Tax=Chondrinema litorale TaxID=2994555 RepID=UPI002542F947|nr:hypothetical protein [Chondrinema litorale]UZS00282.1 hypothetical protein OQ292_40790 [Chondrinema litorale]
MDIRGVTKPDIYLKKKGYLYVHEIIEILEATKKFTFSHRIIYEWHPGYLVFEEIETEELLTVERMTKLDELMKIIESCYDKY